MWTDMRNLHTKFNIPRSFDPNHTAEKPGQRAYFTQSSIFFKIFRDRTSFAACKKILTALVRCFVQLIRLIQTMVKSISCLPGEAVLWFSEDY